MHSSHSSSSRYWVVSTIGIFVVIILWVGAVISTNFPLTSSSVLRQASENSAEKLITGVYEKNHDSENMESSSIKSLDLQNQPKTTQPSLTTALFTPKKYKKSPQVALAKKQIEKAMQQQWKSLKAQDIYAVVLIGNVNTTDLNAKLGIFKPELTVSVQKTSTDQFSATENSSPSISFKPYYFAQSTGKAITNKELMTNKPNLLAVKQIIKNKILNSRKDPQKIVDAVLDLPSLDPKTATSFTTTAVKIFLPKNKTGKKSLNISIPEITHFVDPQFLPPHLQAFMANSAPKNSAQLALTFDDGPSPHETNRLLNMLKSAHVKATFFVCGENVRKNPEIVRRIVREGHEIGSHSYRHDQLTTLPLKQVQEDTRATDKAIFEAVGFFPWNYRPPYGSVNANIAHRLEKPVILWNIDSEDYYSKNSKKISQVIRQKAPSPGSIILLHDIHKTTVDAVPALLKRYGKTFKFVTVTDLFDSRQKPLYKYSSQRTSKEINVSRP